MSDDTLSMLANAAAAFAKPDPSRVRALRGSPDGFDRAIWREMADLGWLSIVVPEALGGLGLNLAAASTVATRIGYAAFPEPFVSAGVMVPWCLSSCADAPAARASLDRVVAGECIASIAWQGDAGGLGLDSTGVSAQLKADSIHLNGTSRFACTASADAFIVAARSSSGLGLYWVERDLPGLQITGEACADGSASARLRFADAALPPGHCLMEGDAAAHLLQAVLDAGTVAASAELVGLMDRALETTLDYLRTRKQFGKAIGSFQVLQHRAVDIWIQRQLARATVDAAVRTLDRAGTTPRARTLAASSAKSRAAHAALLLSTQAVQLHGAIGFTDEYELGIYLNRALTLSAWLGNAAEHRRRYGELSLTPAESPSP